MQIISVYTTIFWHDSKWFETKHNEFKTKWNAFHLALYNALSCLVIVV